MPYADREQNLKYNRERNKKLAKRRADLLSIFPCIACKESDPDIIDWHHVDPEEKISGINKTMTEDHWWTEVLKCVPLCCNCHRKIHKEKLCLLPIHL